MILGAGIAGMTAAWELSKAGYHCTLLEATGRAGGRSFTARGGDVLEETDSRQRAEFGGGDHLYANMGPARIPYHHRTILGYCKEFRVDLEVFTNDNRAALFHNRDRFGGEPVPGRRVMTDLRGYVAELLAKAVNANALDSELSGEDKERVLVMLRRYGGLNPDHLYKGSNRGGYRRERINAGLEPGEVNDPLDFSELLQSDFWRYKLHYSQFLNSNPTLMQPAGGMDAIARAFEKRVGAMIRYGSVVTEVRKTPDGARIVYRNTRTDTAEAIDADFAICTIPAPVLKDVPNDFSPETRAALASLKFVPAVKIAFQARRRFWEEDHAIYGGISWTDQDITQIWYPANGYHRDEGVILGAYVWDDEPCTRFARDVPAGTPAGGHDRRASGSTPDMGRSWSPGSAGLGRRSPSRRAAGPEFEDGVPKALTGPDGPVHVCGDQITALPGWQEGAALAAHAVVNAIGERVAKGG